MEPAPPKTTEAIVAWLVPPACREHVVGDLHERYTSRGQYIAEAVCTIPLVVASRIRRTTDPQVLLMEAFALYLSFLGVAWKLDGALLYEQWGYLRLGDSGGCGAGDVEAGRRLRQSRKAAASDADSAVHIQFQHRVPV